MNLASAFADSVKQRPDKTALFWGEQEIAYRQLALNEGVVLEEKALQRFVRKKLADYKVPRKVVTLSALPRNATGKILKTALREIPVTEGLT